MRDCGGHFWAFLRDSLVVKGYTRTHVRDFIARIFKKKKNTFASLKLSNYFYRG